MIRDDHRSRVGGDDTRSLRWPLSNVTKFRQFGQKLKCTVVVSKDKKCCLNPLKLLTMILFLKDLHAK